MDNPHANPSPAWLSDQSWSHLCELEGVAEAFEGLRGSLATHNELWKAVYDNPVPHEQVCGPYSTRVMGGVPEAWRLGAAAAPIGTFVNANGGNTALGKGVGEVDVALAKGPALMALPCAAVRSTPSPAGAAGRLPGPPGRLPAAAADALPQPRQTGASGGGLRGGQHGRAVRQAGRQAVVVVPPSAVQGRESGCIPSRTLPCLRVSTAWRPRIFSAGDVSICGRTGTAAEPLYQTKAILCPASCALRPAPCGMIPRFSPSPATPQCRSYIEPQDFKLGSIFLDSVASMPIVFVLSPGSDPMADLLAFAEEKRKKVRAGLCVGGRTRRQ